MAAAADPLRAKESITAMTGDIAAKSNREQSTLDKYMCVEVCAEYV